jgi:hypothetical protein
VVGCAIVATQLAYFVYRFKRDNQFMKTSERL